MLMINKIIYMKMQPIIGCLDQWEKLQEINYLIKLEVNLWRKQQTIC